MTWLPPSEGDRLNGGGSYLTIFDNTAHALGTTSIRSLNSSPEASPNADTSFNPPMEQAADTIARAGGKVHETDATQRRATQPKAPATTSQNPTGTPEVAAGADMTDAGGPPPISRHRRNLLRTAVGFGAIAALGVAFLVFSAWAHSGWFVAFGDNDQAIIYQGRPNGMLWMQPTADVVGPERAEFYSDVADAIDNAPRFDSFEDAVAFVREGVVDGIIQIGSCVAIDAIDDAREVICTEDPAVDLVVEAFVPSGDECPGGTVAHRDGKGMGVACVGVTVDPGG